MKVFFIKGKIIKGSRLSISKGLVGVTGAQCAILTLGKTVTGGHSITKTVEILLPLEWLLHR